ncbi:hypothetical protein [Amycolatopsis pigmentata]|uniref:MYXO-CTERM domain-containing protein n=1 Tax=Amycolatopsis pigmentata TaxID=450801 RepID=A0ABW5G505_9PSEU
MRTAPKTVLAAVALIAVIAWTMLPRRREPGPEQWMAGRRAARDASATVPKQRETK